MTVGSVQDCPSTLPEIIQERRVNLESASVSNSSPLETAQQMRSGVEPANIDINSHNATNSTDKNITPIASTTATEAISSSTIDSTLLARKNPELTYQNNNQHSPNSYSPGLLIDIKV